MAAPGGGQRLCVHHPAVGLVRGLVLYLHPFAEEMNKSRRMAALASRALAQAGFEVLQIDLHGCGDSSGEFADATWAGWLDDALLGARWLRARHAEAPLWLWGLRAGCLLATEAAARLPERAALLFWQPPAAGKTLLQQFLRLKMAGDLIEGQAAGAVSAVRAELAAGRSVEIAGYALAPALARGLEAATLAPPPKATHTVWLESHTRMPAEPLPVTVAGADRWRAAGHSVALRTVNGPAFWQTQETELAPELLQATVDLLQACPAAEPAAEAERVL
jgi:uncharacterized protein